MRKKLRSGLQHMRFKFQTQRKINGIKGRDNEIEEWNAAYEI